MATSSPFVPLDQSPQAITLTVRSLLQRVQQGKIRIPPFQRPLRWRSDDVVKLFDSIQRGYPIGSLLFWKKDAPADPDYRIGNAPLPLKEELDAWWIVDGQQRITALAAALLDFNHDQEARWLVKYDPARNEFLPGPLDTTEVGRVVPASILGDLRRLGKWLTTSPLGDVLLERVENVQQRILDYDLSAYVLETASPEALEGVFARVNSTGVRMRSDEVFQALFGQQRATRGSVDLNALQQACDIDSFGEPPRGEVLKAVLAMSGQDPTQRLEALGEQAISKLIGMTDATDALLRTIRFLQAPSDALEPGVDIPCYAFLPYPIVFVVLARWFHVHPNSSADTRRLLAQWLWRGAVTGVHERAAVSKFRRQLKLIEGNSERADLDALTGSAGDPERVDWTLQPFHARNAASRLEILALLTRKPSDRAGPISWRALVSGGHRVAREIIASPKWNELSPDEARLARTAANRALLDTAPTGLEAEFRRWSPITEAAQLESHLINAEMWADLSDGNLGRFLRRRGAWVQSVVSEFLTKRAGIGAPVIGSVDRYADDEPDLDDDLESIADVDESTPDDAR